MPYDFLVDSYATERLKVLQVWSQFRDADLPVRPHPGDHRGRSVLEQMVHQCLSEDLWFRTMLGVNVTDHPLPEVERPGAFIHRYAADSAARLGHLRSRPPAWWEEETAFFEVRRSRAWVLVRRIAHTSHHRGQQTAVLRMLGRALYSTYGPTADTGGLPKHGGTTLYAYPDEAALLAVAADPAPLPGPADASVSERPEQTGGGR